MPLEPGQHHVERVVDGDTILVDPHSRVRLIGVNAPETVKPDWPVEPWGPEASAFTKHFLAGGEVRLEFDDEPVDEYGRYLAYVWVDDKMLNEELVRAGLAHFERGFHYSAAMKRRFGHAEADAKRKHLGIWSGTRAETERQFRQRKPESTTIPPNSEHGRWHPRRPYSISAAAGKIFDSDNAGLLRECRSTPAVPTCSKVKIAAGLRATSARPIGHDS